MANGESLPEWQRVNSAHESVPSYDLYQRTIQKPETDHREYRFLKLRNGLKVTVVHDPNATKAAVSLNVAVGHLSDPDDMPSLTLLCFRVLHRGTKEFPKESEFTEFLTKSHGEFDAETDASNTKFHFNVASNRLSEALRRFSALFHCPLFLPTCISQELKALVAENKKQSFDASLRVMTVLRHLSKNGHVLRQPKTDDIVKKINVLRLTGKVPSNADIDLLEDPAIITIIRKRLMEWWEKEYCASRMDLCIVSKESLEGLAELAATMFSPIRNRRANPLPMITEHPVGADETGKLVMVQAGADIPQLQMTFPIDYQGPLWRHKPALLFSLLLEQKGPGSLHAYLEGRHWITALRCAPVTIARGIDNLELTLDLTDDGLLNYRSIILIMSNYFSFIRGKSPLDPYHQRDCAMLMSNGFRFSELAPAEPHAMFISETMQRPYPPELLLAAPRSNWEWGDEYETSLGELIGKDEKDKFHEYVKQARLENARVVLSAKKAGFARFDGEARWEKEPFCGTLYSILPFEKGFLKEAESASIISDFSLPAPNVFIPTTLYQHSATPDAPFPVRVWETPLASLWKMHANVPKTSVVIDLRSPVAIGSLRKSVLNMFFAKLVQDALVGTTYAAFLAGHQYIIMPRPNGFTLVFYGYTDKLSLVIQNVLGHVKNLSVSAKKVEETIHLMRAVTLSRMLRPPRALSDEFLLYLMAENEWNYDEIARELDTPVTVQEIDEFRNSMTSQVRMLIFMHGNVPEDETTRIADAAQAGFGVAAQSFAELESPGLVLPSGCNFVRTEKIPDPEEIQSAITFYLHIGPMSDRHRDATALILSRLLFISLSDVLGQISREVRCELLRMYDRREQGIVFGAQGERDPAYVEERLEALLENVKGFLDLLTDNDLKEFKRPFRGGWALNSTSPMEVANWYDMHLYNDGLGFEHGKFSEEVLKTVTIADVRSLFASSVLPSSKIRSKLSVHMCSQNPPKVRRISTQAAEAFKGLLEQYGEDKLGFVIAQKWSEAKESLSRNPTLFEFRNYWAGILAEGEEEHEDLLDSIPSLIEQYPVTDDGLEKKVVKAATYIEDVVAFKMALRSEGR
ncbi:insulin-degrading enzyme [Moniliophthora roreri MCA 2997]|uniref:Insulin-degrading enzyme n=1 Tax=Moniliophthora roreri (strain MCA 2997) TaxID=1381753 RepID=V2X778_MONRO|nr:insulin-degrading enzyme [Moniliophthora roreri MCA 2997]